MKSKYYYEYTRNMKDETAKDLDRINNKLFNETAKERNIPSYYIGSVYGYEARKVVEDWNLSYNIGTAVTYLLRAGKKVEQGMDNKAKHIEDIKKTINHLKFEIERLENEC
jgi:hypothetical protein